MEKVSELTRRYDLCYVIRSALSKCPELPRERFFDHFGRNRTAAERKLKGTGTANGSSPFLNCLQESSLHGRATTGTQQVFCTSGWVSGRVAFTMLLPYGMFALQVQLYPNWI